MSKSIIIPILTALIIGIHAVSGATRTGNKSEWPVVQLRPTPNANLSLLFDSGIRPYRFPRMENYALEAKHIRVVLIQSSEVHLPEFGAEMLDIDVKANSLLSSIVLKNSPTTLPESRKEMLPWVKHGTDPERTEIDLDSFLNAVEKDYRGYNYGPNAIDHNFSIAWKDENAVKYVVWFQQARHPVTPLALHMGITFPLTPIQASTSYNIPIPPPPGYENVDMTAPKDFGPDNPPDDPEIERVRKAGVMPDYSMLPKEKIQAGEPPPSQTTMAPLSPAQSPVLKPAPEQPSTSSSAWLWWLGALALAVLSFFANVLRKRRH